MVIRTVLATFLFLTLSTLCVTAQEYRWQQRVEYTMDVRLDVTSHKLTGTQKLVYHNNSPDTLDRVYYHLYFNAFQPGSMMDVRSRTIADPDKRVGNRIESLSPSEIGYQKVISLKQDNNDASFRVYGTIMEVTLPSPILPGAKTTFDMAFEAQVPKQIRRSGRDNNEGIDYSMTQWYPKLAEYDFQGWHINQYVAREFHGVWGDYDITIRIDPTYVVAASGVLQNGHEIGHGYETEGTKVKKPKGDLEWHFIARDVHDFAWAADPDYAHDKIQVPDGPLVHFFYQKSDKTAHWGQLPKIAVQLFTFLNEHFGKYPYSTYSVIQGGDGGMEYPMCTLILGEGELAGTSSTMIHEIAHSWFQGVLANNESQYAWMDEGFTRFAEYEAKRYIFNLTNHFAGTYRGYANLAKSGKEEPSAQFADFFTLNSAYTVSSYLKGCIMLHQLRYIIGEQSFWKGIRQYYETWKFRHPEPIDFIRVMEKASGMQLKWYLNYWIHTTKQVDYTIKQVIDHEEAAVVNLERKGELPMPIDLMVTYQDGSQELYYIPMNETWGAKPPEVNTISRTTLPVWNWVDPYYTLKINKPSSDIAMIEIDPTGRLADVNPDDNQLKIAGSIEEKK